MRLRVGSKEKHLRLRRLLAVLTVFALLAGSAAAATVAARYEADREREKRRELTTRAAAALTARLATTADTLRGVRELFARPVAVTPEEFRAVAAVPLEQRALVLVAWLPRVPRGQVERLERTAGVRVRPAVGARAPAPGGDLFPVVLVEPRDARLAELGADAGADPARAVALRGARDSGEARATAPIGLGSAARPDGVVVYQPVYAAGARPDGVAARRAALVGFVAGAYRIDDLAEAALALLPAGAEVSIHDAGIAVAGSRDERMAQFAGRRWRVAIAGVGEVRPTLPIAFAVAGIALAGLVGLLFLQTARRERDARRSAAELREGAERVRAMVARQAALREIATAVASGQEPGPVLRRACRGVAGVLDAAVAAVVGVDDDGAARVSSWWAATPDGGAKLLPAGLLRLDAEAILARVRSGDDAVLIAPDDRGLLADGLGTVVAAGVRVRGRITGAFLVAAPAGGDLPDDAGDTVSAAAELVALAIVNADARAALTARATTDALTGLANQRAFHERLRAEVARAKRGGRPLALALLDLDHFKQVNDRHGHQVGDRVLAEAASRIAALARAGELVARVGGEEFAWILPDTDGMGAFAAAERARRAVAALPFPGVGRVTVSAGVCELEGRRDPDELFRLADAALYWAKAEGRDRCVRYSRDAVEALAVRRQDSLASRTRALGGLRALARSLDARSAVGPGHSVRVADVAVKLATALGWSAERTAQLHEAALVHDVGDIGVPDGPPDPLAAGHPAGDAAERADLGGRLVGEALGSEQVAWIRGRCERWDGAGQPDGLAGDAIPDGARLLAVADALDELTGGRAGEIAHAVAVARGERGRRFDPDVVDALERLAAADALGAEADSFGRG